jgi:hypothetical protein
LVEPMIDVTFSDDDFFDFPTSLAFGTGAWDKKSVYVVGIGAPHYGFPFGSDPKLTRVKVGVPGH